MDVNFLVTCHYVNMIYSWLEMKRIQYLEDRLAQRMDERAQKLKTGKNETGKYSNSLKFVMELLILCVIALMVIC